MLSPTHEPEVRESGSECDQKRGPRRGTNCLGSVQSSQRRLSQNNYILKNCLVDFIGADSVGYLVGYKCVYHLLGSVSNSTPQEVDSPGFRLRRIRRVY
jgi:hypothetical protein